MFKYLLSIWKRAYYFPQIHQATRIPPVPSPIPSLIMRQLGKAVTGAVYGAKRDKLLGWMNEGWKRDAASKPA